MAAKLTPSMAIQAATWSVVAVVIPEKIERPAALRLLLPVVDDVAPAPLAVLEAASLAVEAPPLPLLLGAGVDEALLEPRPPMPLDAWCAYTSDEIRL